MPLARKCGKERLGCLAKNGMSYSGMEYLPDEISLDKRDPSREPEHNTCAHEVGGNHG